MSKGLVRPRATFFPCALMLGLALFELTGCSSMSQPLASFQSQSQDSDAVRDALLLSSDRAADALSQPNNLLVQLPQTAQTGLALLRQLGFGTQVDKLQGAINQGVSAAITEAKPIFAQAIRQMTIRDATKIVFGGQGAATAYFRAQTESALRQRFHDILRQQLQTSGYYGYYQGYQTLLNLVPANQRPQFDVERHLLDQAMDQLYAQIGTEEAKIRQDPIRRGSALIGQVFKAKLSN